jgi:hypothetical protein
MKLMRLTGVLPYVLGKQKDKARDERGVMQEQMGKINAERASIEVERKNRESELTSRRNKMALGMARARKNRGGFGFGSSQPSANQTKSTLG